MLKAATSLPALVMRTDGDLVDRGPEERERDRAGGADRPEVAARSGCGDVTDCSACLERVPPSVWVRLRRARRLSPPAGAMAAVGLVVGAGSLCAASKRARASAPAASSIGS